MRFLTKLLAFTTLFVVLLVGYAIYGSQLNVTISDVTVEPSTNQQGAFQAAENAMKNNEMIGTVFSNQALGPIENYSIVRIILDVSNNGILPAEWIDVKVKPVDGDVLQFAAESSTIGLFTQAKMQGVILTKNATANVDREVVLEYYVYGRLLSSQAVKPTQVVQ